MSPVNSGRPLAAFCDRIPSRVVSAEKGDAAMKGLGALVVLGLMGIAPVAMSQNVFTGTWRPDPQVFSPTRKTDVIELANSIYECRSCSPPYKIKVDGHDQTIEGNANYDALSLTVVDDRNTIEESDKNDGKIVKMSLWSVGPDGKTMHVRFDDMHGHVQEQDGHKVE